nr:chitinase 2-like [Tanacetum cinerariifolium]
MTFYNVIIATLFMLVISSCSGDQLLASFISKGNKGLPPNDGFFEACKELKSRVLCFWIKMGLRKLSIALFTLQNLLAMASQQAIAPRSGVISFASIAPYDDDEVQKNYMALCKSYGDIIDYMNFQFYAYGKGTTVSQFINYFQTQSLNYEGGNILASFSTEGSGGLSPKDGFFKACNRLKSEGMLGGILVWSADSSKNLGFRYEKESQALLAVPHLKRTRALSSFDLPASEQHGHGLMQFILLFILSINLNFLCNGKFSSFMVRDFAQSVLENI